MSAESNYLDVKIMGREYRVACAPDERDALLAAVRMVDGKMSEIAQRTRNTVAERVAVMAALNIAHEHLAGGKHENADAGVANAELKGKISAMGARIDAVLTTQQQVEV